MSSKKEKFYITTSIAYTNAPPHLGFALELVQADVIARHHRILGEKVFFLTGTDEHGQKIVRAAKEAGKTPKEFTDEFSLKFKKLKEPLNISNDDFIRTTDKKRHWPTAERVWLKLKENRDIYKKKYKGFYCVGCEAFVKEKDLINGKCSIHKKEAELIEEENWFFRLSRYAKQIEKAIKEEKVKIIPIGRKNEMLRFINQKLEDVSFSRPSKNLWWGIPVPGDKTQTTYVWEEALVNYLSALDYPNGKKFKEYWPVDVHCLGKDILRFHVTIWLGMLLSLKLSLPKNIFVHGFITSDSQKMSKSLGNVIDPFELVKKYGTDPVRYFLLREITPTEDGDFTYEKFEQRYNSDLAKGLGNLVARVVTLADKYTVSSRLKASKQTQKEINITQKKYKKALKEFKFNEALVAVWKFISLCDEYIEREKPWEGNKKEVVENLLVAVKKIAELLEPFLPQSSEEIIKQLKNKKSKALFPRI